MNADFIFAQLRVALVAGIAWAGGRGYFTPTDSALAMSLVTSLLPIAAPWLASLYATYGTKKVPASALAVDVGSPSKAETDAIHPPGETARVQTLGGTAIGKVVGALLLALLLFRPVPSQAGPIADARALIVADLTAARDEAKADNDPSEQCWQILLDAANNAPTRIMGAAHAVQRARHFRRNLPKVIEACAVVRDGARQAVIGIFGAAAGGAATLGALGL